MTQNNLLMLGFSSHDLAPRLNLDLMRDINAVERPFGGFAERLRQLRQAKGLSQTELGEAVDLHYTHIGRYERGASIPSSDSLKKLADVLGVTTDYLLEGTIEDAAKADFQDRELLIMFKEVDDLNGDEKVFIKRVLDALLTKKKIQALAG